MFNPGMALLYTSLFCLMLFIMATVYCKRKRDFWLHKSIWRVAKRCLKIQSILVPIRKAPPPPGARIQHPHSFGDPWGDSNQQQQQQQHQQKGSSVLHVKANRPVIPESFVL